MKKNVIKTAIAAVCVVAAGMGGIKAYNAADQSKADMLLANNVEALSDPADGMWASIQDMWDMSWDPNYENFAELGDKTCEMSTSTTTTTTTTTTSTSSSSSFGRTTTTTVAGTYKGVTGSVQQTQTPITHTQGTTTTTSTTTSTTTPSNPHMHKKCQWAMSWCDRRQETSCAN